MGYEKVNGCTQSPSKEQIATIIVFAIELALHGVFVVPGIFNIANDVPKSILIVLLVLFYLLLLLIIYDFIWITFHDPVDPILLDPDQIEIYPQ